MRQVILDTETTGLDYKIGHRIIEIGCIELIDRQLTENHFHHYINPGRTIDPGASKVHGITSEFLADKPKFNDIINEFIHYIRDAELIIHNAPFDIGFLNHELKLAGKKFGSIANYATVFDTLTLARQRHPGQRNSLDAICKRYDIDNSHRDLHGALLDSEILAKVYLHMTGGQDSLFTEELSHKPAKTDNQIKQSVIKQANKRLKLTTIQPKESENTAHQQFLEKIRTNSNNQCLWDKITTTDS